MTASVATRFPKLRALDVRPYQQYGRSYLLLRDPFQLTDKTMLIPQPLAAALFLCDGTRDVDGISRSFALRYGLHISPQQVQDLVDSLDEALMLDNDRSAQAQLQVLDAYRQASFRTASLAGPAYPAEPAALGRLLDDYLREAAARHAGSNGAALNVVRGLLSPHIDYPRGGLVYAQVWRQAMEAARAADLVVLFGTDHYGVDPFTLTRQNYATPYGVLPTEVSVVDALAQAIGEEAAYAGELRHRLEHSLELVAVWLHHVRGGEPCAMAPILCGGLHQHIQRGSDPVTDPLLNRVLDTLHAQTAGRRVLVAASGDLAHVGTAFGGAPLDATTRQTVQRADTELLDAMRAGDAAAFFRAIQHVDNAHNVCGVAPIYLTMRLLERMDGPIRGQQAGYAACPADATDTSLVTIGGVVFT